MRPPIAAHDREAMDAADAARDMVAGAKQIAVMLSRDALDSARARAAQAARPGVPVPRVAHQMLSDGGAARAHTHGAQRGRLGLAGHPDVRRALYGDNVPHTTGEEISRAPADPRTAEPDPPGRTAPAFGARRPRGRARRRPIR